MFLVIARRSLGMGFEMNSKTFPLLTLTLLVLRVSALRAQPIPVPNYSFEAPVAGSVDFRINNWQKTPKPDWWDESQNGPWNELVGIVPNWPGGAEDPLANIDGNQAAYLDSIPTAGLFQDFTATDWTGTTHVVSGKFETGKAYRLATGIVGRGHMPEGATMQLTLYYRDGSGQIIPVGTTPVTYTKTIFRSDTNLIDFSVEIPPVKATDPWAGQYIGIGFFSTVSQDKMGGYWDLDNVRLSVIKPIAVPNYSFETPVVKPGPADLRIGNWQKSPKPDWWDESQNGPWNQLVGIFPNTASGQPDHIANLDGKQGAYLFSVPTAGLFQDYYSVDYAGVTHAFIAPFETGKAYHLTIGFFGGGRDLMPEGATLLLGLYYRNTAGVINWISTSPVTFTKINFPRVTNLVDYYVSVGPVKGTDPWAGKQIGIGVVSTTPQDKTGGYWDLDNVRLSSEVAGFALTLVRTGSELRISWPSTPGLYYQAKMSVDLKSWSYIGVALPGTGQGLSATISTSNPAHAFFRVQATPP
jgi:hypothetical protein